MSYTFAAVQGKVASAVGRTVFDRIVRHVERNRARLWGEEQGRGFVRLNVVLTIWKDMRGEGYQRIRRSVHSATRRKHFCANVEDVSLPG